MLFNSWQFIFCFLPIVMVGYFVLGSRLPLLGAAWLTAASLFFYGYRNPNYVLLLGGSICANYALGRAIAREWTDVRQGGVKWMLVAAVGANLLLLGYFKYTNFLLGSLSAALDTTYGAQDIILPLGISFFTFTQIAFLVDAYQGKVSGRNFIHYGLFVTYFPHLIAGPILHHAEMIPQFIRRESFRWNAENFAVGLSVFVIGLFTCLQRRFRRRARP